MSQLKKGAILSYINIALNIGIGLLLTPFIIRSLGDSEYGLYSLMGSLVAYLSLMDLGLNNTIVRFVAKFRAENDLEGGKRFLSTTMLLYGAISVVVVILGTFIFFKIDEIFADSLTKSQIEDARIIFLILLLNVVITLPGNSYTAICNAYESFVFPRSVNVIRYILRAITLIAVLKLGGKSISIVIIDTFFNIAVIIATALFVKTKLHLKFRFNIFDKVSSKEILSYSFWIFLMTIISQFQWNIGQIILGMHVNTKFVAVYAVGIMLGSYYGAFSAAISGLFIPRASFMVLNNSHKELTDMMIRVGRISLVPLFLILTAFIFFGKAFILLWLGYSYVDSYWIALIIMIAYTIPLIQTFAGSILEVRNKVSFKAKVYGILIGLGIGLGYYLIALFGSVGMILGISIGWLSAQVVLNFYYAYFLKLDILRFFGNLFRSFSLPVLISSLIGFFFMTLKIDTWFYFIFYGLLYSVANILLIWFFSLNEIERKMLIPKVLWDFSLTSHRKKI